jgi:D-methionine transport system substrate-binding protein
MFNKILLICSLSLLLLPCCKSSCRREEGTALKVVASAVPHAEMLEFIKPDLRALGIDLNIIVLDDYNVPNRALAEKEADANFFQHLPYLKEQVRQFHFPIIDFAHVEIEPMGLYSRKFQSLSLIPERAKITLPNDPTNEARALVLLEKNGLIKLQKHERATVIDIIENPHNFSFVEVDAVMLPRTLDDASAAVINANLALQAGLNPAKDALILEDKDSSFVNVLAIRKEDENSVPLKELKAALTSEKMRTFIMQKYKGAIIPAF